MIPGVVRGRRGYQNSSVGVGAPEKTSSILLFAPSEAQVGSSNLAARLLEAGLGACADQCLPSILLGWKIPVPVRFSGTGLETGTMSPTGHWAENGENFEYWDGNPAIPIPRSAKA